MIHHGDCLEILRGLRANSVDAVVTDPPYGLSFMGKKWDYEVPGVAVWQECLRVLKPGGHLLAFAGTRTQHRMAVKIEDAGFEIRDMIAWVYGSGFPKSLDVSKAIDKAAGAEREVVGKSPWESRGGAGLSRSLANDDNWKSNGDFITAPATDSARQWDGWGTALKPALEPITVARKPLVGTVADNVLAHGTGALNIDGCRVPGAYDTRDRDTSGGASMFGMGAGGGAFVPTEGRWPANLIHDGSEEALAAFPEAGGQQGDLHETGRRRPSSGRFGDMAPPRAHKARVENGKSAARFFYCPKASKADRDAGLEAEPDRVLAMSNQAKAELARGNMHKGESGVNSAKVRKNNHPTVKPTELMRYLCRLVTPPGGTVLDPFMGSGSTGKAAVLEGFDFIGIEREADYVKIAAARIAAVTPALTLKGILS